MDEQHKKEIREKFLRAARKAVSKPRKTNFQTLATYVPKVVHKRLQREKNDEPECEVLRGVVLFTGNFQDHSCNATLFFERELMLCARITDISGFTHLTEKLTRKGPEGVELLTSILNTYFGKLISIINSFNGGL
jgi:hypothetical protein